MAKAKISLAKRIRIFERDGNRCRRCGRTSPETRLELDHIVPLSRGGTSSEDNLQTLCVDCNKLKLDHLPGDSAEAIIYRWCEEVFGPIACNQSLRPHLARRLVRRLSIVHDFTALLNGTDTDDQA